jgi:hypothetical protein
MKRLQSWGIGPKKRRAEILTEEKEEILWKQDLLGDTHHAHCWTMACILHYGASAIEEQSLYD